MSKLFDISGHGFYVRAPRPPLGDSPGDVEPWGLRCESVMMVVVSQDLADCLLLAYDYDGQVVFRDADTPGAVLDLYDKAARAFAEGLRLDQHNAQLEAQA